MGLDLRIPLGLMFLSIGAIMLAYGVVTLGSPIYMRSLGANVNIGWGAVMFAFGLLMFLLGRRSRLKNTPTRASNIDVPQRNRH